MALGILGIITLTATALAATDLAQYREFRLGSSTALVLGTAGATEARDLKTVHRRPALLQELQWRPPYRPMPGVAPDPVREVVFSFVDDQLFQMLVTYERSRTEGLTAADMTAALSETYGPAEIVTRPQMTSGYAALDSASILARWRTADTSIALQHYDYGGGYALVITSVPLEARARAASASAVASDKQEAPAREAARLKSENDASRDAAARTRSVNKDGFKP